MNPKTKTVACQTALKTLKGAEDEQSKQFWVEKERLLFVRLIRPTRERQLDVVQRR